MNDGVDAAERVAEREVVGEVAEGDLNPDSLGPEPPRVTDEAADRHAGSDEPPQQRSSDVSGGAGEQQHGAGG